MFVIDHGDKERRKRQREMLKKAIADLEADVRAQGPKSMFTYSREVIEGRGAPCVACGKKTEHLDLFCAEHRPVLAVRPKPGVVAKPKPDPTPDWAFGAWCALLILELLWFACWQSSSFWHVIVAAAVGAYMAVEWPTEDEELDRKV